MEKNRFDIRARVRAGGLQYVADSFLLSLAGRWANGSACHPACGHGCRNQDPGQTKLVAFEHNAIARLVTVARFTTAGSGSALFALPWMAHSLSAQFELCADLATECSVGGPVVCALLDRGVDHFSADADARNDDDAFNALMDLGHE